jgi:hypothetical protein
LQEQSVFEQAESLCCGHMEAPHATWVTEKKMREAAKHPEFFAPRAPVGA